jgi:hypothetical protein
MKKTITFLAVIAALALAGPAAAAKTTTYKGKTSAGHPITIKVKANKIRFIEGGVRMSCIPIQGGGAPKGGSEVFGLQGKIPLKRHQSYSLMGTPAFHWKEVTIKHDLWLKRRGKGGVISGRMRLQYSFLVSKFPIGTFSIYSCLGGATFKATARK